MDHTDVDILLLNRIPSHFGFAAAALEKFGYRLHRASAMREALLSLSQQSVDLILCGLELEDISGQQLLSFLKRDPLRESIPFIFLVPLEHQNALSPKQVFGDGAEDLIFFPIEEKNLVSRIRRILRPDPSANKAASQNPPEPRADQPVPSPAAGPPGERRKEERKKLTEPVTVEVSVDGKTWLPGQILNTSRSGVMIETELARPQGQRIFIRNPGNKDDTAIGSVAHILLGEKNQQIGMGISFYENAQWASFLDRLLTPGTRPPAQHAQAASFPIPIKVSGDGSIWVDGRVTGCDLDGAAIETVMLGKPGNSLQIKFQGSRRCDIVQGTICEVGLESGKLPARIRIGFDDDGPWPAVWGRLSSLSRTGGDGQMDAAPVRTKEPSDDEGTNPQKQGKGQKWAKTVLIKSKDQKRPESAAAAHASKKAAAANHRFYQSLIGRRLDNYEVVSFISSGAMGGVFKGWDTALERDVALKVISWELSSQEKFVEMFFKEARFVSKLNHPNISQIYHIGNADDVLYLAMEFVHGENLLELNKKRIRHGADQIADFLRTTCLTMDYVWENKIIHRDLKPANIMLTRDNRLKIVDFGVAQMAKLGENQSEDQIVGSPLYLSPEAILNQKLDLRSDIYSLGATFYHLIAGSPPFVDLSLPKILHMHLNQPIPPLNQRADHLPNPLCRIIEKMMAKKAEERFQSYPEIVKSLEAL